MANQKRQQGYPRISVTRKIGSERFLSRGKQLDVTLLDFWQWSSADLVNNSTRGILAEYIIAQALGIASGVREPWKAYDLDFRDTKIEVKSAGYLQSWYHKELSKIIFPIRPTVNWDAETNKQSKTKKRRADIYIFCLLKHKDKKSLNPLNLDQWEFYILPTTVLNRKFPELKSIGLARLQRIQPTSVVYSEIKNRVVALAEKE